VSLDVRLQMRMPALVQRQWKWLLPLVFFAPAALLSTPLREAYFRHFELPRLASSQAPDVLVASCETHVSMLPERAPKHCAIAHTARPEAERAMETFYFEDGSRLTLESRIGRWRSSSATCTAVEWQGWLSGAGMMLLMLAMLAHSIRTRQFFHFPGMKRKPMNDFESILGIYGALLFAGGFVGMAAAQCAAMRAL
jgi:hypothetical protein